MLNRKRSPFSLFPTFSKFCGFLLWDFDLLLGFVIVVVFLFLPFLFIKLSSSAILIFLKLPARSSIAGANISPRPPALQGTASPVFPEGKKVQDWDYVFGSWMTFQRRKKWICESRCQVSDRLHVFAVLFCLLTFPSLQFTLGLHFTPSLQSSFFILHPAYLILSVSAAVFILHSVCILSLVRSQQSSVYHIH